MRKGQISCPNLRVESDLSAQAEKLAESNRRRFRGHFWRVQLSEIPVFSMLLAIVIVYLAGLGLGAVIAGVLAWVVG